MPGFDYEYLSDTDRANIMRERLRHIEAEHFRVGLEVRLAATVGDADQVNPVAQIELAALEVKAAALRAWLDVKEPADA